MLREEKIFFSAKKLEGTSFILIDNISSGVFSLMTIGNNRASIILYMSNFFNFMVHSFGEVKQDL